MPDDCGLNPPIDTLPQIAQERAMRGPQDRANEGSRAGRAQTGRYDSTRPPTLPLGRYRPNEEDVASVPTEPIPGRSLVTRRAVVDIVRTATLGSYGVTGFSGGILARIREALGFGTRGLRVSLAGGIRVERDLTVGYGLPIAEVARQVDSAVRYGIRRALEREVERLTIHVNGLRYQPTAPPAPPVVELASVHVGDLAESGT